MRFTIKLKLALAFALIILLSAGMAGMAITQLSSLNAAVTDIVQACRQPAQLKRSLRRYPKCDCQREERGTE